jgi:hypothetical protein
MIVELHIVTIIHEANAWRRERVALAHKQLQTQACRLHASCIVRLQREVGGVNAMIVDETKDGGV